MKLGEKIRDLRESRGLSLNELARRSNVSPATISRLENENQESIRVETLKALCRALGITLGEFFGGADITALPRGIRIPVLCMRQVPDYLSGGKDMEESLPMIEVEERQGASQCLALLITDVSMQGERYYFAPNDVVIIDPQVKPVPGDYVLALVEDQAVFRQYKMRQDHVELSPLNPFWPTVTVGLEAACIVGVMIEHRRYRTSSEKSPIRYAAVRKN